MHRVVLFRPLGLCRVQTKRYDDARQQLAVLKRGEDWYLVQVQVNSNSPRKSQCAESRWQRLVVEHMQSSKGARGVVETGSSPYRGSTGNR